MITLQINVYDATSDELRRVMSFLGDVLIDQKTESADANIAASPSIGQTGQSVPAEPVAPLLSAMGWPDSASKPAPGAITPTEPTPVASNPAPDEAPAKKERRRRRTKAEMAAARAAESGSQGAVEENTPSTPAVVTHSPAAEDASSKEGSELDGLSFDEFKAELEKVSSTEAGMKHIIGALNAFGYERLREVQSGQFQAVIDRCNHLIGEA